MKTRLILMFTFTLLGLTNIQAQSVSCDNLDQIIRHIRLNDLSLAGKQLSADLEEDRYKPLIQVDPKNDAWITTAPGSKVALSYREYIAANTSPEKAKALFQLYYHKLKGCPRMDDLKLIENPGEFMSATLQASDLYLAIVMQERVPLSSAGLASPRNYDVFLQIQTYPPVFFEGSVDLLPKPLDDK